ncbi:SDR family NAD(P)-dependent oxidoreductase [Rhodococcus sp. H29-C3]|uniref:SDR family NAD(P)-dependent oxidoreductase n=1 Tax=Rhodococcus sp. H29-C3 TaxID=3046307 RepID=UPI0024B94D2E|nr:SDR family NAD(P)-dependent oxidoreductase [Rhodococcus sp. H29-C3]MDJ0362342.1 SDR family NAD(P)-dependent oxidoreductase [Rhodococcus sp. H29-C3]
MNARHAIVTGASSGIGLSVTRQLADSGFSVTMCARDGVRLASAADELRQAGADVAPVVADVTRPDDVRALVTQAVEEFGPITTLVNNAGRNGGGKTAELSNELWDEVIAANLTSVFYVTRAVLDSGGILDSGGQIINIASTAGKQGVVLAAPYSASKHGVVGFTKALGKELAQQGVTVNAVCPGYVETPMAARVRKGYAEAWDTSEEEILTMFEAKIPLGRYSTPDEVASMVTYLTSPGAASVTAQAINVCGGLGNY